MKAIAYRFCGTMLAMPLAAYLLPGVHTRDAQTAWIAGMCLGLLYLVIRPLFKLIATPLNCLTFGLLGFLIDALLVSWAATWMEGFTIDSFLWALAASFIVSLLREGAGKLAGKGG